MQYRIKLIDDRQDAICKFFADRNESNDKYSKVDESDVRKKIFRKSVILKFICFGKFINATEVSTNLR